MTVLYLDSSAIGKLYLQENDAQAEQVLTLSNNAEDVASSAIAYAEVVSALARNFHEGKITEDEYQDSLAGFQSDWEAITQIEVTKVLVLSGQLLKANKGLRAMDALHLASALTVRQVKPIQFLSFDTFLNSIAKNLMPEAVQ